VGGQKTGKKMKVPLNSNDKLFTDIRDANFSTVLPILNRKAKEIDEYYKVEFYLILASVNNMKTLTLTLFLATTRSTNSLSDS
jgi:hypothetical protein